MISGTFHISSQEWRYFSREKSIIHTAHLSQLPSGTSGETVLIDKTAPPSTSNNNFSVPPVSIPSFPDINVVENVTFSRTTLPDVYGSVGLNKTILAQKGVIIQFAGWYAQQREFYMTPNASGWYFCAVMAQSDNRDASYLGPDNPATSPAGPTQYISCGIDRMPVGFSASVIAGNRVSCRMEGFFAPWDAGKPYWSTTTYSLDNQLTCVAYGIAIVPKNNTVVWSGTFLGNAPDAQLTGYMFKIADIP